MDYLSKNALFSFLYSNESWRTISNRNGEQKLADTIQFGENISNCTYLILGISEDIGPQLNHGLPGSKNGFGAFLNAIQNIQSNIHLAGNEIGILGEIKQNRDFISIEKSRDWVNELDDFVFAVLSKNVSKNQTIIVIGGGHNNAYPLLKFAKTSAKNKVHAYNIDPHADCRFTDYRHSGNPFSYAVKDGFLDDYTIIGLHESYNNAFILDFISSQNVQANYFENFLDDEKYFWENLESNNLTVIKEFVYTLDLDIDSVAFAPASALTPSGFSVENCRKIIRKLSSKIPFYHFHLPEGAPVSPSELKNYGKMVSYFVLDFIKCQNNLMK